tara:strand:- start:63704 stop:64486 length:783 start_codon:yes stop_codon:yes gene_type:complete
MFNKPFFRHFSPFLIAFLAIFTQSCEQEPDLQFTQKTYTNASLEACSTAICPKIDIHILEAQGESKLSQIINDTITNHVIAVLSMTPDDEKNLKSVEEALDQFISSFRQFKADFAETSTDYETDVDANISLETENLLCIAVKSYTYFGGAHGYGSVTYFNFDKNSETYLSTEDLIKDKTAVLKEAEKRFRKQQKIPADGNINSTGYFFEDDKFILPKDIGFDDENLILQYNPYDVAAYSVGQITVKIPLPEIKAYLRTDL